MSTFAIAQMLQVDPGSVANWIDQGLLKAHRTPGGHRRVQLVDLLKFLRSHKMPIPSELRLAKVRILIVDDEPAITQLIASAIKEAHNEFELFEANDGFKAGTMVATLRPDIVILDLKMPGMDGFDICKLIKSQEATRHTEVLAITAHDSPENETRILDCGAKVYLKKPIDLNEMIKQIEACL